MAITWHYIGEYIDSRKRLSRTIQEGVDGTPTDGKVYTSKAIATSRADVEDKIKESLRQKILARRAEDAELTAVSGMDLTNFETFINS